MKKITILLACFTILSFVNTAQAVSVNIPLTPSDWSLSPYIAQDTPPPTLTQAGANLRGTVLTGNGGSPYGMEVETNDTYNFQNATLRFQWRTNGLGYYSQSTTHLSSSDGNVSHNIANNGSNASFTTHHSFAGSQTIDDAWLYTEITYNPTGMDFSVSYGGYNASPISSGTNLYTSAIWDRLDDAMFRFRLVDNYLGGTYFELAELNLVTPVIPEAVPIPASIFLFGSALLGLFGFKSKSSLSA